MADDCAVGGWPVDLRWIGKSSLGGRNDPLGRRLKGLVRKEQACLGWTLYIFLGKLNFIKGDFTFVCRECHVCCLLSVMLFLLVIPTVTEGADSQAVFMGKMKLYVLKSFL